MTGKKACVAALLVLGLGRLHCQDLTRPTTDSEVATATAISALFNLASVGECFLSDKAWFPCLFLGTVTLQELPALIYGSEGASLDFSLQLGFDGLFVANGLASGSEALGSVLFNFAHKYSMFSTYAMYSDLRARTGSPDYGPEDRHSFAELLSAPFDPACYAHWSVLGYLGTKLLIAGIGMALADPSDSVWARGEAYIGNSAFPVWAGVALMLALQVPNFVMTGVGEEALFRGVYYEELSRRIGEWPAKIGDALYFTVCHYPQQWDKLTAEGAGRVAMDTALTMLDAIWLQYIYEWQGLRSAVATHAAVDILGFFCDWLLQGGVPNTAGFSVNDRVLSISFTYRL
jgi:membrane protease YdiL (CAAX protease family)